MPFLLAFACALAAAPTSSVFQCSKSTLVELAGVRPARLAAFQADVDASLATPLKISCQAFQQRSKQQLIATCRTASGDDVACLLVRQGLVKEVRSEQRRYEISACKDRPEIRREI